MLKKIILLISLVSLSFAGTRHYSLSFDKWELGMKKSNVIKIGMDNNIGFGYDNVRLLKSEMSPDWIRTLATKKILHYSDKLFFDKYSTVFLYFSKKEELYKIKVTFVNLEPKEKMHLIQLLKDKYQRKFGRFKEDDSKLYLNLKRDKHTYIIVKKNPFQVIYLDTELKDQKNKKKEMNMKNKL